MAGKNDRQRRQAREKYRRQQEVRIAHQRQVRRRALVGLAGVALVGLLVSLLVVFLPGGSGKTNASATTSPTASASATPTPSPSLTTVAEPAHHCTYSTSPGLTPASDKGVGLPPAVPDYTDSFTATLNTNLGPLKFNLLNSNATCTVNSFIHLAKAGFFNKTQCHRLVTSGIYVLQCGDPYSSSTTKLTCSTSSSVGTGNPGYEYASENLAGSKYPAGTVAMANSGTATSNGSQFFIVFKDSTSALEGSSGTALYTPFATVSSGLDIVQNVAKDGYSCQYPSTAGGGAPKEKVIINSVTISKT